MFYFISICKFFHRPSRKNKAYNITKICQIFREDYYLRIKNGNKKSFKKFIRFDIMVGQV